VASLSHTQPNEADAAPCAQECEREVAVPNPQGIHTRPAMLIAKAAGAFDAEVTLSAGDRTANAKSTLQLLSLATEQGTKLVVRARGAQAQKAVDAVVDLVRRGFDEM